MTCQHGKVSLDLGSIAALIHSTWRFQRRIKSSNQLERFAPSGSRLHIAAQLSNIFTSRSGVRFSTSDFYLVALPADWLSYFCALVQHPASLLHYSVLRTNIPNLDQRMQHLASSCKPTVSYQLHASCRRRQGSKRIVPVEVHCRLSPLCFYSTSSHA